MKPNRADNDTEDEDECTNNTSGTNDNSNVPNDDMDNNVDLHTDPHSNDNDKDGDMENNWTDDNPPMLNGNGALSLRLNDDEMLSQALQHLFLIGSKYQSLEHLCKQMDQFGSFWGFHHLCNNRHHITCNHVQKSASKTIWKGSVVPETKQCKR